MAKKDFREQFGTKCRSTQGFPSSALRTLDHFVRNAREGSDDMALPVVERRKITAMMLYGVTKDNGGEA